jgi:hypothetical protein
MTYGILIAILVIALIATLFAVVSEPVPAEERERAPESDPDRYDAHSAAPVADFGVDRSVFPTEPAPEYSQPGEIGFEGTETDPAPAVPEVMVVDSVSDEADTLPDQPVTGSDPEPPLDLRRADEEEDLR